MRVPVIRVRVDVKLGSGTARQRLPVEVYDEACALRPCLVVDTEPRRTGDPPVRCEGLCARCGAPGTPAPESSLAKDRGISRQRVERVTAPYDPAELLRTAAQLDAVLDAILGSEEE